jgi:hypothetical protein
MSSGEFPDDGLTAEHIAAAALNALKYLDPKSHYFNQVRNDLKSFFDRLLDSGRIGVWDYVGLLYSIPPSRTDPAKEAFDSVHLIVRKLPSDHLVLAHCPQHGWELDVVGSPRDIDNCFWSEVIHGKEEIDP